jgi:hypothetical protein
VLSETLEVEIYGRNLIESIGKCDIIIIVCPSGITIKPHVKATKDGILLVILFLLHQLLKL